jgi:SET domain-containing protein
MIKEKNMYKPLPESLTIKQSGINGLGLFAQKGIAQGTNLGVTHLEMAMLDNKQSIYRTPLGGFINHSNTPNVVKVELRTNGEDASCVTKKWSLVTLKDIKKGEELTVRYTFYNI